MMGGVANLLGVDKFYGRGKPEPPPPPDKYEATVWGRYAKILLSSSEFLFIN